MKRANRLYFRVGLLLVAGALLLLGFVLFLTAGRFGNQGRVYETYLSESVQGLDVGSGVRYRGVAIGRLTEIGLVAAEYGREGVPANSGALQLVFVRFAIDTKRLGAAPDYQQAVDMGLRTRIASQGITGVSYLELDFVEASRRTPVEEVPWSPSYPVIPSIPSTVATVTNAAEALAARLNVLDIEGLVGGITALVTEVRQQFGPGDVGQVLREAQATLASLRETATAVETVLAGPALRGLLNGGQELTEELRTATGQLPATIRTLEATLRSARHLTSDTQADLVPILRDLRATTAYLRETAEALRRAPGQAIFGRPPERR